MLQRLGDQRRINIAKSVLKSAVQEQIAPDTPVALRVFGHREPDACRTDLEVPLAPLDVARMSAVIDGIQAKNLARTPIADSLSAIRRDFSTHQGRIVVVLVTDGEETCEGDPEAVLAQLARDGVQVSVNIVGFAIDDETLKTEFNKWARLGGGEYFDAGNKDELESAISQALRVPFRVYDNSQHEVAHGLVNGPEVELPEGVYSVEILSEPVQLRTNVVVTGEQRTRLAVIPK